MDTNKDGSISVNEFIGSYVEGEIKLKERLNEVNKVIAERRRQIDEFGARLGDARQGEVLNNNGIMENSLLTVHVVQAEDLRMSQQEGET